MSNEHRAETPGSDRADEGDVCCCDDGCCGSDNNTASAASPGNQGEAREKAASGAEPQAGGETPAALGVPRMKAAFFNKYGGPEVMELGELHVPAVGPKQLLVRVRCASVNPIDIIVRAGGTKALRPLPFPQGLGYDVSGIVEEAGAEVTAFKTGDRLFARSRQAGTIADLALVDEDVAALMDEDMTFEDAAATPLTALTALQGLRRAGIQEGSKVFISGGGGGVGTFAIQLARHVFKAAEVVTTASAGAKTDLVATLGATRVVNYREEKFEDVLEQHSFDVVLDTTGEAARMGVLPKKGGKVQSIAGPVTTAAILEGMGKKPNAIVRAVLWSKSRAVAKAIAKHGCEYDYYFLNTNGKELEEIREWMKIGRVRAVLDSTHEGMDAFKAAYEKLEGGRAAGKIVIRLSE